MSKIILEKKGEIALMRLSNGVTNPISPQLVDDLLEALEMVKEKYRGLVLAGGTKFFSIGLDLPKLLKLTRDEMRAYWEKFLEAVLGLFTLPVPTACAIAGHAPAGGTILAICCDYRFAAGGRKMLGLNEIQLGLPVPQLADAILRQVVGDRAATEIIFTGKLIEPDRALKLGLVDEVHPLEEVEDQAVKKITEMAALPQPAMKIIKANRVENVRRQYEKNKKLDIQRFLDCWFSQPVQDLLAKTAEKF